MNTQLSTIRCALADLTGAWQDWVMKGRPDSFHDWESHEQTIVELATMFDLMAEVPEELK